MAISSYGPYYESKIQSKEKTKKALTGQGYTPEELAGATYGELMARYKDAEVRRQQETDVALRQQQLGLYGRELRGKEKAAKSAERGEMVKGIATGIDVLHQTGVLEWGGDVLKTGGKAISGLFSSRPAVMGTKWSSGFSPSHYGDWGGGYKATGTSFWSQVGTSITTFIKKGTVICTELYRQGLLDEKTYLADSAYGALLDDEVLIGYHFWAEGVANKMRDSKILTKIVSLVAIPWAKEMAYQMGTLNKGHWFGRVMNIVGIPICRFIGRLIIRGGLRWEIG